jgi:outer membrane protein TolC
MNSLKSTALLAATLIAGCATFSKDGGFAPVAETARRRLGHDVEWQRTTDDQAAAKRRTRELLARPLSVDDAVQIALINNRALQASFESLGIAEADLVASGRLPNPRFTLRHASTQGLYDIEETASLDALTLLSRPWAHAIERRRFAAVQNAVMADVASLAARTRAAYFEALAARDVARYRREVREAAETGVELARRMRAAGHWNGLDEAREQSFYLEAGIAAERADLAESVARESLIEALGIELRGGELDLAERLPELPAALEPPADVEAALAARIDLQALRESIDALARELRLTRATRFVDVLDAGAVRIKEGTDAAPYETGYEISFVVPLFDGGAPEVRRAAARYAQAVDRFQDAALAARAEVRKTYAAYRTAHEIAARERDQVLPLRRSIAEQDLERFNAAQISVFDLLADARAEIAGREDYIRSVRDFWVARSALDAALTGPTRGTTQNEVTP